MLKVIWEAEALIFQNSSGKFMNVVKSYTCDNVFIEDYNYLLTQSQICFANSALESLFVLRMSWLTDSVKY